jgi:hypothetical protein
MIHFKRLFLMMGLVLVGLVGSTMASAESATALDIPLWECAANNVGRTGPFYGYGPTLAQATGEALAICRNVSVFPCWIIPNSCYEKR